VRVVRGASSCVLLSVLVTLGALSGCGGGGSDSSSPSSTPPRPVASALDFTIVPMVNAATEVAFRWSGVGASAYRLEIGSSSGASDTATFEVGGATTYTWRGVAVGVFYARVKGLQGSTVGPASNEVVVGSIDARQMIDALIFGFGPLAVAGNAAGPNVQDQMDGWQPGTGFEVILGESVSDTFATSANKTVAQIGPATRGAVRASIRGRAADPLPTPRVGEVTISVIAPEEAKSECECDDCVGCAWTWYSGSFTQRARILVSSSAQTSTPAHELGHVIGLGHIISAAGVRPPFTMGLTTDGMFSPNGRVNELDPATIRMLETIYGAGLTAGTRRRQFEAAGLVSSGALSASPRDELARRPSGYKVTEDGLETVVRRPLCGVGPSLASPE